MEIPLLSCTFLSAGFIDLEAIWNKDKEMAIDVEEAFGSLSIDMIEVEDQEAKNAGLPPFPRGQVLNNWTSIELPVVFKFQNE